MWWREGCPLAKWTVKKKKKQQKKKTPSVLCHGSKTVALWLVMTRWTNCKTDPISFRLLMACCHFLLLLLTVSLSCGGSDSEKVHHQSFAPERANVIVNSCQVRSGTWEHTVNYKLLIINYNYTFFSALCHQVTCVICKSALQVTEGSMPTCAVDFEYNI